MDDLISRQEAYKVLTDYYHHKTEIQHIGLKEALNRVPYAQPEIVRCKGCKFWREHKYAKYAKETKRYIPFCGLNAIYTNSDDFCSKGERRTDEWMGNS